jgi:hypothetical protein
MMGTALDALNVLKEYGLAGVLAWLFWWTLRRMMASHDATVRSLKEQIGDHLEAARAVGESFSEVVQNHLSHATEVLARLDGSLSRYVEEQRPWQDRLVSTLVKIESHLASGGKGDGAQPGVG